MLFCMTLWLGKPNCNTWAAVFSKFLQSHFWERIDISNMIRFGWTWTPILVAMIILWGYFWTRLSKCLWSLFQNFLTIDFTICSVWSMDCTWHVRWVPWFTVLSCFKVLVFYALLDWHLICNICKPWKSREVAWLTAFSAIILCEVIIVIGMV